MTTSDHPDNNSPTKPSGSGVLNEAGERWDDDYGLDPRNLSSKEVEPPPERIFVFKRPDGGNSWHTERLEDSDIEYTRVSADSAGAMGDQADKILLEALRRVRADQDSFWTFYQADPLMAKAADRIEELLRWHGTEQSMHAAWRKRAEEAEAQLITAVPRDEAARTSDNADLAQSVRIGIYNWTLGLADDRLAVITNKDIQALADMVIAAVANNDDMTPIKP